MPPRLSAVVAVGAYKDYCRIASDRAGIGKRKRQGRSNLCNAALARLDRRLLTEFDRFPIADRSAQNLGGHMRLHPPEGGGIMALTLENCL